MATTKHGNAQKQHVLHEFGPGSLHRIVLIGKDGTPDSGEWYPFTGIAKHRGYRATTTYFAGTLPTGVFKCSPVVGYRQMNAG